ncbi:MULTISPECIES: hypothetical protein [unclassified Agarivorans]|uniref:hypothetical protein n=1 Tax=unclassified Agarivorans TaxID=2636026 RepID=UPI0026E15882|nr:MULTISPECIES: hypothetical protein [unclassified Agarivorans]MDO6687941.1 hypothetical protein [Agarivorans sp. 3_MG-2023]MDO6717563.1 hypothetical protein [Agarivorans sp. 2_MG-2023]
MKIFIGKWRLLIASVMILSGCASNQSQKLPKAQLSPDVKYQIQDFDIDLSYSLNVPNFLDEEHTETIMAAIFQDKLNKAGLLASASDQNVAPVSIYIDYKRIFAGEATPFPMDTVTPPKFIYSITSEVDGEKVSIYQSKELMVTSYSGLRDMLKAEKNVSSDVDYSIFVASNVAKKLIDLTLGDDNSVYNEDIELELTAYANSVIRDFSNKTVELSDHNYIPAVITDDFVDRLNSNDAKVRKGAYKDIQKHWLNQPEIFDLIESKLLSAYQSDLSEKELSEAKYQMETLARSGLIRYQDTLIKISKEAKQASLKNAATGELDTLTSRHIRASAIHRPLPNGVELDWNQHQIFNMIRSNDAYLQKRGVKTVYKKYPKNPIFLDELSLSLDNSVSRSKYKSSLNADYHAWICRVLGLSENKKYKEKLDYVALNAREKKVRNFAEEYAEELE